MITIKSNTDSTSMSGGFGRDFKDIKRQAYQHYF